MTNANCPRKLRICHIAPKAYPVFNPKVGDYFGGANVDLYYLATELAKDEQFESSFIVADYGQPDGETIEGVKLFKALDFKKGTVSGAIRTWRALKRADADIYMMKCAGPGVPLAALFCMLHKRSFVYRLASMYESDGTYLRLHPIAGRAFLWSLKRAGLVFAQNAMDADNLLRTFGIKSIVIPNGHRLDAVQSGKRDGVLWVGRDASEKRPQRFIELARAVPEVRFTMICQTSTNNGDYVAMAADAAKTPNLTFIRHVPFNEVDAYFQRTKVFVNTSDAEGFPNTFIQACRAAAPILSFKVNPDGFLDKYKCGLCAGGSFDRMTKQLRSLLEDGNGPELGANGRKYVEARHNITPIAASYKAMFRALMDENRMS